MTEMILNEKTLLVVDPGSKKSGVAVLLFNGDVLEKKVCLNEEILDYIGYLDHKYVPSIWLFGDKGAGREISQKIQAQNIRSVDIAFHDEHRSSEEGRKLYWQEHPPTGWRSWIPLSFQIPGEPWDDWAAVVIGRRWLEE